MSTNQIFTITGPSCAGKTTMQNQLQATGFEPIISFTTRPMRAGEIDGRDYYFISKENGISRRPGDFIECNQYGEYFYGIYIEEINRVLSINKPIVVVIEPNGVKQIEKYCLENRIKTIHIYIDISLQLAYNRILYRMLNDYENTILNGTTSEYIIPTYAKRILNIQKEKQDWYEESILTWDLYFKEFTPENEKEVLQKVMEYIK